MSKNDQITKIVWTRQAQENLIKILEYRYAKIPKARAIVRKDIIQASKKITYALQYQADEITPKYRRIIVRDYKLLYRCEKSTAYIMNIVCTKAKI